MVQFKQTWKQNQYLPALSAIFFLKASISSCSFSFSAAHSRLADRLCCSVGRLELVLVHAAGSSFLERSMVTSSLAWEHWAETTLSFCSFVKLRVVCFLSARKEMTGNIHLSIVLESGLCIYSVVRSHLLIIKHQRKIVGHIQPNKSGVNLLHCCNLRFLRSQFIFNFVFWEWTNMDV